MCYLSLAKTFEQTKVNFQLVMAQVAAEMGTNRLQIIDRKRIVIVCTVKQNGLDLQKECKCWIVKPICDTGNCCVNKLVINQSVFSREDSGMYPALPLSKRFEAQIFFFSFGLSIPSSSA